MQAYDKYKDSGIDWLGEIPEHWEVEKGKWMFEKNERPVLPEHDVITCFRDGQVTLRKKRREDGFTNSLKEIGYQGIAKGDLIIHQMDAFAGAIGVSDSDGKSTPVYSVCSPRVSNINNFYYAYFLRNMALSGLILSLAKGIRERSTDFRFNDFANLFYPLPPIKEQEVIATFLDDKCGQLDGAVRIKQQQIEKLKELRQITIHNAVTKGINPDAEMKDSGIDWIGEIPKHWELKKNSYISEIRTGATPDRGNARFWNGDIPWIKTGEINYNLIVDSEEKITRDGLLNSSTRLAPPGSIIMAMYGQGVTRGKVAIVGVLSTYNQACCVINYDKNILSPKFALYFYTSTYSFFRESGNETSQMNLSSGYISTIKITAPPLSEQKEIVTYLEAQTSKIDQAITLKTEQIAKLNEYKQSLINEVVTGKVKVTN